MANTNKGFRFRYRLSGGKPTIQLLTYKDTETLSKGDLVNIESGYIDLGATNDTALAGVLLETQAGTTQVTQGLVITDPDAVYGVYDPNARVVGATLDISGTTGAMTVATSSNVDLLVVANSTASEETLVQIHPTEHFQTH